MLLNRLRFCVVICPHSITDIVLSLMQDDLTPH